MSDNRPSSDDPYATPSSSSPSGGAPAPGSAPSSSNVSPYGGYVPPVDQGAAPGQPPYGAPQQPYGQQAPYGSQQAPYGAQQPQYGAQQPYGQPYPGQPYPAYGAMPDRSGNQLGVWSLVLAIATFFTGCFPAAIVGIVLGAKGRRAANEGRADNGGLATTGWILNIVLTVLTVLGIVLFFVFVAALGGWDAFMDGWNTGWETEITRNAV